MTPRNGISGKIQLAAALRVKKRAVISFVGGGGKTSSMFRLASELSAAGYRVVTTTTTHISEAQVLMAPTWIGLESLDQLESRLDRFGHCLLIGPPDGKGRVLGALPQLIDRLHSRSDVDFVLVEADGSRSRPLKAPGIREPVVPDSTTILVPIAGMNAIGTPLDEDHVHRAEIVAGITGQSLGSLITPLTLSAVLADPLGGGKLLPKGSRLVPMLNKAGTEADLANGRQAAGAMLADSDIDTVILSSMIQDPPVLECHVPVAAIVLAAGMSTRFGHTKQTAVWKDTNLTAQAVRTALHAGLNPVFVITGSDAGNVEKAVDGLSVKCVYNPEFSAGQSTSIRRGLDELPLRTGAVIFMLADQPLITPETVRKIVQAHRTTFAPVCVPVFEGRRGNPVLFDRSLFQELRGLSGDTGGRGLMDQYGDAIISVPADPSILADIDTPADYENLINLEFSSSKVKQ